MTLKLIDRDLRNKYAEALYKNELAYGKEIDSQFKRLSMDLTRNSQMIDAGSQIFLNRVRQKRLKWSLDDTRFRDHYKLVCRNVFNRKLDNLHQCFAHVNNPRQQLDPFARTSYEFLQRERKLQKAANNAKGTPNAKANKFNSLSLNESEFAANEARTKLPKLPKIGGRGEALFDDELYARFNVSDREFLEKFPTKVEVTGTDVGKQYIENERQHHRTLRNVKKKFSRIQSNALSDPRLNELVGYLDS